MVTFGTIKPKYSLKIKSILPVRNKVNALAPFFFSEETFEHKYYCFIQIKRYFELHREPWDP